MDWSIEPILPQHDCKQFKCGKHPLDYWLKKYALINQQNNICRTRVLVKSDATRVMGYYALSACQLDRANLPERFYERLPPAYPTPAILLAQLAVHRDLRGQRLGAALLAHSLRIAAQASENVGVFAIAVHAIDDEAMSFYTHFGFEPLADNKHHLFLPTDQARQLGLE